MVTFQKALSRGSVDEATNQIPSHAGKDVSRIWL